MKPINLAFVFALAAFAAWAQERTTAPAAPRAAHVMVMPADLKWTDPPPGLPSGSKVAVLEGDPKVAGKPFTMRARLPANYRVMPHHHPTDEHVTVLSGTFLLGMGDRFEPGKMKELPAGSFVLMPAGQHHFAMAKGETVIQIHGMGPFGITYINPADDPRNQAAK